MIGELPLERTYPNPTSLASSRSNSRYATPLEHPNWSDMLTRRANEDDCRPRCGP